MMDTDENIAIIKQLIKEPIIEIIKEKHKNKWLYICVCENQKFLVKTISASKKEYFIQRSIFEHNDFFCQFYTLKQCNNKMWLVCEWVEGETLDSISNQVNLEMVALIKKFVTELKKLHSSYEIPSEEILITPEMQKYYGFSDESIAKLNNCNKTVIHGDLHLQNLVITKDKIVPVDYDDVRYGYAYEDLVYFADIHKSHDEDLISFLILQFYFDFNIPNDFWKIVYLLSVRKVFGIANAERFNSTEGINLETWIREIDFSHHIIPSWYPVIESKVIDRFGEHYDEIFR